MVAAPWKGRERGSGRFLYFPIPCPRSYVWNYETCSNIKRVILLNEGTAMKKRCSCQARAAKRINFQRRDRRATKIISGTTAATVTPERSYRENVEEEPALPVNLHSIVVMIQESWVIFLDVYDDFIKVAYFSRA